MKVVSDTAHGILDYLTVAIFALAPGILGLTGFAALVSYALAAIHLIMTLLTNMPLGVVKIIPMRLHALVEMLVDLFLWWQRWCCRLSSAISENSFWLWDW